MINVIKLKKKFKKQSDFRPMDCPSDQPTNGTTDIVTNRVT